MPLLLLWHPLVSGGVNPPQPTPTPAAEVVRQDARGAGGARYPQHAIQRRKRERMEEDELVQLLAVVIPLISRPAYG